MRKILAILLALVLTLGCASAFAELTFTTGGTSGTYYAFGNVLAQFITNNSDVAVTAVAGNGSADNIDKLDLGAAQLGFVQNDVAYYAYNGIRFDQYIGMPVTSFTALCALYNETVQLITCNPDIKSVEDLRGKNVSIGSSGSGVYFNAMDFFAAYGMTEADIVPQYLSFGDSAEALKDGKIDAAFIVAGAPTPAITELCTTNNAYLVPIDGDVSAKLIETCPFYTVYAMPAGTYPGQTSEVKTVTVKATLIVSAKADETQVYNLTKAIFDNMSDIAKENGKGSELSIANATSGMTVPFHAGAAKYFAEQGFTVPTA